MYATDFLEKEFLNVMKDISLIAPGKVYLGLYITNPNEQGGGVELSYSGYERQEVKFNNAAEHEGTIQISNQEQITFPTTDNAAGTVTYIGISDNKTGGNMLAYGRLTEELEVRGQEAPVFMPGEIKIYSTGSLSKPYKKKLLNVFNGQTIPGVICHLALFNGSPDTGGAELIGENYERVEIEFTSPEGNESGQTVIRNNNPINFNRPTTNWGNWNHTVVMDAKTLGEPIWIYDRGVNKELKRGYMPIADANTLRFAIN